ncbi:Iron-sulfur cluster carrier protein [bacterium HR40]|nr:Iron-sulfur cluster carrier protein [bacterium HR40]
MNRLLLADPASAPAEESMPANALAFVSDAETRAAVETAFSRLELESARIENGDVRTAIERLGVERSPRLLVVDLEASQMPLSDIDELAEVCEPGVSVVAIGRRDEVALFRSLLERGVADYFVKPVPPELLAHSLRRAMEGMPTGRRTARLGRVVAVLGVRGGVGATTIACGLAHMVASRHRRRVAVLDLDLHFGTVALSYDLDPVNGLRDVLERPEGLDPLLVERLGNSVSENLSAFAAELPPGERWNPEPAAVEGVLDMLRHRFHYVFVDLPRHPQDLLIFALERADVVLFVVDLSLASMRDTLRLSQLLTRVNPAARSLVLANRVGWLKGAEIDRSEFERGIGRSIDHLVPFDGVRVVSAVNTGQLDHLARGRFAAALELVSHSLTGRQPSERRGLLGLLRRGR